MEWLQDNWALVAFFLMVADKVVAATPNKYDDLIFTAVKGVVRKLAGKDKA